MFVINKNNDGLIFKVVVQPRSSSNMIVGVYNDAIKIKITAAPVDGAANSMCINFLAKLFKIPKSSINIISGQNSRTKKILIKYKDNALLKNKALIESLTRTILNKKNNLT